MLILGIDPGFARLGWGVVDQTGHKFTLVEYGCIETDKQLSPSQRLHQIHLELLQLIKQHRPDVGVIEDLFFNTNAKTAIRVGEARGVILLTLQQSRLPIFHYTPLQIKSAITGYGRADKTQIQKMVKTLLNLDAIPKPDDTADALAVSLTHAYTKNVLK